MKNLLFESFDEAQDENNMLCETSRLACVCSKNKLLGFFTSFLALFN
jgi:hypothetical protein